VELKLGCGHLSDDKFLSAFEECGLTTASFHHADHVRLAWLTISRFGAARAEERLLAGIYKMAAHANAPKKFLHTTTVAWVRLIAAARRTAPASESFAEWITRHPEFLDRDLLDRYYSKGILTSQPARDSWVEPDLAPLVC
jgi:hypothetical protein